MAGKKEACPCGAKPELVFTCSGASDVGEIADRAARKLTKDGAGRMYCLAGIGGRVSGIMTSTQAAETVLVLDGCPHDCARNTMEQAGFKGFGHLRLSDLGLAKGQSPATEERIASVAAKAAEMLVGKKGGCCG